MGRAKNNKKFGKINQMFTEAPCLADYANNLRNIVTTNASTSVLGKTLWQKQGDRNTKLIAFSSRYLTGKKSVISIVELELLTMGIEKEPIYGSPSIRTIE